MAPPFKLSGALWLCIAALVVQGCTLTAAQGAQHLPAVDSGLLQQQADPVPKIARNASGTASRNAGIKQPQPLSKGFLPQQEHKTLLPIDYKDVALFLLSFMVLSLAAGAGIGGGVLLVPMLSLITGFGSIQTVALSNVTIFAGAVTNMFFNLPRRNPFKPGPIIDYDLLLLFGPMIVMGSIAGSYINYFVPGWVTKALVLLVLAPMTWRMVGKARMLWVAETRRTSCGQQGSFIGSRSLEICSSLQEDLQRLDHSGLSSTDDGTVDRVRAHQQQLAPLVTHSSAGGAGAAKNIGIQSHPSVALSPMPSGNHQHKCPLAQRTASLPGEARGFAQLPAQSSLQGPSRTLSHANLLAALSLTDRPPSLADLLGPYFLLLTTPQAADATLQAQALSRALALHHSHVTRRHTLDAPSQNSPCFKHSSSMGSRPSSAPTIPSDWEADLPKGPSCGSPQEGNPLSIISPFQLYQQQRCQQMKAHDKAHEGDEAAHQNHHHQQQQPQNMSPLESEQMPVAAKVKCNRLDHSECVHTAELESKMRKLILHHATAQVPKAHLGALLLMLSAVVATSVAATLRLTCGTWQYWLIVLVPLPLMLCVWAVMRWHVLWRVGWQEVLGMTYPTDIKWTPASTLTYPAIVITVGIMAGMLGLGGGIVLAPLLLELGVQPAVSAASSQAAMLMSSCTSTVVYLVAGALPKDYGIAMTIIGFVGTLCGQIAFNMLVQRTGRSSILVLILAVLFLLASAAAIIVISNAVTAIVHMPAKLTLTHAHDICAMRGA